MLFVLATMLMGCCGRCLHICEPKVPTSLTSVMQLFNSIKCERNVSLKLDQTVAI